jgi:DNA-directed RNA polymerase subunit RPC12/RpoP
MRSETKPFNSVAFDLLQRKNQIACRYCHDTVSRGTGRMVLDDSGTLAITAWTCTRCGTVIEEIRIMARGGKAQPRPVRYAVAPSHPTGHPVPIAYHWLRN